MYLCFDLVCLVRSHGDNDLQRKMLFINRMWCGSG